MIKRKELTYFVKLLLILPKYVLLSRLFSRQPANRAFIAVVRVLESAVLARPLRRTAVEGLAWKFFLNASKSYVTNWKIFDQWLIVRDRSIIKIIVRLCFRDLDMFWKENII